MRTTIELSDALLRRAKKLAARRQTTLRALIEEGLRRILDEPVPPYRLPDLSYGEGGLAEGLDASDWDRIRDLSYESRGA
jgi:hypothetical protein